MDFQLAFFIWTVSTWAGYSHRVQNLREAIAAPYYALTCGRVRIRVIGGATDGFSASLRVRKMR
jgi:hypothetical protein